MNYQNYQYDISPMLRATSAKVYGIVALLCCLLGGMGAPLPLALSILALVDASKAKKALGYLPQEAKTGKICGIVALILSALQLLAAIASIVLVFVFYILVFILSLGF